MVSGSVHDRENGLAQDGPAGVRAVRRAIAILKAFSPDKPELTLSELARHIGLAKSTTHRLLSTLEQERLIYWDAVSGRYRLGTVLFELGSLVISTTELRRVARPTLEALHRQCQETIHLATLDAGEVVYIEKLESRHGLRMQSEIGRRSPAYCTGLGKVLLSYLPMQERLKLLTSRPLRRFTKTTMTSVGHLKDHLERIRLAGYAIDNGEHEELVRCVAAPVFDHTRTCVAAISIATVALDVDGPEFTRLIELCTGAAREISQSLGCIMAPPQVAASASQSKGGITHESG